MNPAIIVALLFVVLLSFTSGLLIGLGTRTVRRNSVRVNQNRGEAEVRKVITASFSAPQYHLLNNITVPFKEGTTQIDHILVSTKGIFVIETKNYSGWIFGDENSRQWT